ncbi:MAG: signal recognition particle protein [Spirochaetes bacterium]|nr:signal recognition particle protein [Spirochaetota bacterium]MBP8990696.1 signal recognition particle protein [Spirochaetota bacterium]HOV46952.1 signal recognition particle protein [Exilispira sp.]HQQ19941.1 signal recognition particle protein [Exilispira sp.]
MLESIAKGFDKILTEVFKKGLITESNIKEVLPELKKILIEADVNYEVVDIFLQNVEKKAIGQQITKGVSAREKFIKIVFDELVYFLGEGKKELKIKSKGNRSVILLAGLQGSGKTTTAAKLAKFYKGQKFPLLVAADIYRPAAIEQLQILGAQIGVEVFTQSKKPADKIVKEALNYADSKGLDLVIIDTAGRLQVEKELMDELKLIANVSRPDESLLVVDSMMGQVAAEVAREFTKYIKLSGVILTKFDSDTKGGAALSVKHIANVPIIFSTSGEQLDAIDYFYPDRIAQRMIGMGDILSLVEKAQKQFSEEEAEKLAERLEKSKFDFNDMLTQIEAISKMGGFDSVLQMIPAGQKINQNKVAMQVKRFANYKVIIQSMTKKERNNPLLINNASRRKRIAKGSGTKLIDVLQLMKDYDNMKKMIQKTKGGKINPEMLGLDPETLKNLKL